MTGGVTIVNGPQNNGNGAVDYDNTFDMQGGMLIAAGSIGMAQAPSESSKQASINVLLPSSVNDTLVTVKDSSGKEILSFMPAKTYQSIIISSPKLIIGESYSIYYGGDILDKNKSGLYEEEAINGGTLLTEFTLTSSVMTVDSSGAVEGNSTGMHGGMKEGPGGRAPGMQIPQFAPEIN